MRCQKSSINENIINVVLIRRKYEHAGMEEVVEDAVNSRVSECGRCYFSVDSGQPCNFEQFQALHK